ncbi:NAD(+) diphosphatase [Pontiellaceae bacterium B1224]|nr:NAD(+) diphosphatase [Pontiellaceae bacterium B1224]
MTFNPAILPETPSPATVRAFLFSNEKEIQLDQKSVPLLPPDSPLLKNAIYLGLLDNMPCYTARLDEATVLPTGYESGDIRSLHGHFEDELYALIGYASQILTWSENHQFCSRCGTKAEASEQERAMVCPACGLMNYPRISPSMIVAVTRGNELLMARGHHFPEGLYSVVAGFVEPGENLEQCVAREVMEETGLEITNIKYHSSQPWPFPHSLMVGFTADYVGGEIRIDPKEIADAGWYTANNLPEKIPSKATIARKLIDHFLSSQHPHAGATR